MKRFTNIFLILSTKQRKTYDKGGEMPIAVLLLFLAPVPVAVVGMQQEYTKEQKVIELCTQKFNLTSKEISCL